MATSRACQVGERSSCSASSCSSSTTIDRMPAHGDHTALRPPITTSTPAGGPRPLVGMHGGRVAELAQTGGETPGVVDRRVDDERRAAIQRLDDDRQLIAGRWQADQATADRHRGGSHGRALSTVATSRPSSAGCAATRNGRSRPAPQRCDAHRPRSMIVRRRTDPRPLGQRHQTIERDRSVGRPERDDPTADPPTVQHDTRTIDPDGNRSRIASGTR